MRCWGRTEGVTRNTDVISYTVLEQQLDDSLIDLNIILFGGTDRQAPTVRLMDSAVPGGREKVSSEL